MSLTAPPATTATGPARRPPRIPRPHPVPRAVSPRVAELAAGRLSEAEFWESVEGTPLLEADGDGDGHLIATFLWRGSPATRAVAVLPNKVADPRDPAANRMDRVLGTDVWHWSIRMRRDWRASYWLRVDEHDGAEGVRRPDPLNPRTLHRRWGEPATSYVELPGAPGSYDWEAREGVPRGRVTEHRVASELLGNERAVWSYEPPGAAPDAGLPVLVLFDGDAWQPALGIATLLDNLIADGRIPPLVALLPAAIDADTRYRELGCDDRFVGFLDGELLPWAAGRFPVTRDPARTVVAGQSLGGLTAAYAAVRAPHRFGNVLSQSGSFWWDASAEGDGARDGAVTRLLDAAGVRLPVRFRLSAGEQEWVNLPANRRLRDVLAERGYEDAEYREYNGGHDYLCWRTELADGLCALLGPASTAQATAHAAA